MKSVFSSLVSLSLAGLARGQTYTCGYAETYAASNMAVALRLDYTNDMVYITMTGTVDEFFAAGFGSTTMEDTYAIVVDDSGVSERQLNASSLGLAAEGMSLNTTVTVESDTDDGSVRTVVLSRALAGLDDSYYTFGQYTADDSLSVIWATNTGSASFVAHDQKGSATIDFVTGADADDVECSLMEEPTTTEAPATYICGTIETSADDNMAVSVRIDEDDETITRMVYITMTGPDSQWFGAGFGSSSMSGTYAIIVDDSGVSEWKLGSGAAGDELTASLTTESDESSGGIRTVLLSREVAGTSDDYYTFVTTGSIDLIWATTSGAASFVVHDDKGTVSLTLAGDYAADATECGEAVPESTTDGTTDEDATTPTPADDDDGEDDAATSLAGKIAFACVMSALFAINV